MDYRKFVIYGLELYRLFFFLIEITIATSLGLFPYSSWRKLPARNLEQLINPIATWAGNSGYTDVLSRVISFMFSYVVMRLFLNHMLLAITLAFSAAQGSMFWMLLALKKVILQDTSFGTESEKDEVVIKMFREIQLLCRIYNDIHRLHLIPATIIIFGMAGTCSLFVVVSRWEMLDFQGMIIYGDGLVTCVTVILLLFHITVKIYVQSQNVLGLQRHMLQSAISSNRRRYRYVIRCWRSFPVLKVFFFESNFLETSTTLEILNFNFNWAINLIL